MDLDDGDYIDPVTGLIRAREAPAAPPEVMPEGDDPKEFFADYFAELDKPKRPVREDIEGATVQVRRAFPEADETYVRELLSDASDDFLATLLMRMSKRAGVVLGLLLKQRSVTSWEVKQLYSSETRAIADLVQTGLLLRSTTERSENGRATTRYVIDPEAFEARRESREYLTLKLRDEALRASRGCALCPAAFSKHTLQLDHRIAFALVGNTLAREEGLAAFQLLCPTCNTTKHHECAACPFFKEGDATQCKTCYWAYPEAYTHIAGQSYRRLVLVADAESQSALDRVRSLARELGLPT